MRFLSREGSRYAYCLTGNSGRMSSRSDIDLQNARNKRINRRGAQGYPCSHLARFINLHHNVQNLRCLTYVHDKECVCRSFEMIESHLVLAQERGSRSTRLMALARPFTLKSLLRPAFTSPWIGCCPRFPYCNSYSLPKRACPHACAVWTSDRAALQHLPPRIVCRVLASLHYSYDLICQSRRLDRSLALTYVHFHNQVNLSFPSPWIPAAARA